MRWGGIIRDFMVIPRNRLSPVTARTVLAYEKNPLLISGVAILLCGGVFDLLMWFGSSPFNEVWGWDWLDNTFGIQIAIFFICLNRGILSTCKNEKGAIKEFAKSNLQVGVMLLILGAIGAVISAAGFMFSIVIMVVCFAIKSVFFSGKIRD